MPFGIRHSSLDIPRRRRGRGGFALLITITLLAFLVLLLVSLASLTRVETQVASNTQSLAQARQNALLALNVALGQLQKYTGPDQRVTARADIGIPAGVTVDPPTFNFENYLLSNGTVVPTAGKFTSPGSTGNTVQAAVSQYWTTANSPRNRNWTGVWKNTNSTPFDRNEPAAFNPLPGNPADNTVKTPAWLVSGNELSATSDSFKPADIVAGLTAASTPIDEIKDSAGRSHRLLLKTSAGVSDATTLDRAITAPQVTVTATGVPGTDGTAAPVGHYAWWVGDEGIKARANLVDPYAVTATPEANLARLQSAQRPAIEAMTTDGSDGLAPSYPANSGQLLKVFSPGQLPYISPAASFPSELKARYHDLSVSSRGVLADAKHGGLKRDLTYLLSRPSIAAFRAALNTPDYNVAPNPSYNIALTAAATPYATIPGNESSGTAYDAGQGILAGSATWEQLWSFYNLREPAPLGVFASDGIAASRPSSGTQHPLYPLLVQAKLFYSMELVAGVATLRITPVAVLANPYNVPLSGDFILSFADPSVVVVTGKLTDPDEKLTYDGNGTLTGATNRFTKVGGTFANAGLEKIQLIIKATNIPPGVAQIFTVDPAANLTIAGPNDSRTVAMINSYNPSVYLTYVTNRAINTAGGDTHAALYGSGGMTAQLHMGAKDTVNRVAYVSTKSPAATTGGPPVEFGFLVYPFSNGYRRGGGVFFALQDGKNTHQQSLFYQLNYRSLVVTTTGATGLGDHPLQWGTSYGVIGQDGDVEPGPNPFLSANILPPLNPPPDDPDPIPKTTRWGLVASGEYPSLNTPPVEITDSETGFVNRLYDIPRRNAPVTSLGQLQHFNLTGQLSNPNASVNVNAFLVNYPVANSYPGPRVRRHRVFFSSGPYGYHYDASYIWNDLLWDRFYFSSFPQIDPFDFSKPGTGKLINARHTPFRAPSSVPLNDPARFRGTFNAAENLLADGAFNINSTSVDAWKAVLSSLKGVPVGTESAPSAPFSRTLTPSGGSADARTGVTANAWNGFSNLTQNEINELAEEMVLQVRWRGPFLSLAEFVNRRLTLGPATRTNGADHPDPYRLGLSGALQAAIDRAINRKAVVPAPYSYTPKRNETTSSVDSTTKGTALQGSYLADLEYRMHTRIAGYPGYLLQGDVLSALGPVLAARSDTFTIRTYGDTLNPATGTVTARAWCEAVVQRTPDYVDATAPSATPAAGSPADTFGRRYQIVSFRWLTAADI